MKQEDMGMNNTLFSNSFVFREFRFKKSYRYTDMRSGADQHFVACMRKGRCRIVSEENTIEILELHAPKADRTVDFIDHSLLCEPVAKDAYNGEFELK